MARYYQDFVGLNTFVYETVGYDVDNQVENGELPGSQDQIVEPLSDREIEVLYWIERGLSNREIAQKLYLSQAPSKLTLTTYMES